MIEFPSIEIEIFVFGITTLGGLLGLFWKMSAWQTEMRLRMDGLQRSNEDTDKRIRDLNEKAAERTNKIYARFDQIDNRYNDMDRRLVKIESRLEENGK